MSTSLHIFLQGDAVDFLKWVLNALHLALGGTKKAKSSIIYKSFCGGMRIHSKKILPTEIDDVKKAELEASGNIYYVCTVARYHDMNEMYDIY